MSWNGFRCVGKDSNGIKELQEAVKGFQVTLSSDRVEKPTELELILRIDPKMEHLQIDRVINKLWTIQPIFVFLLLNLGNFTSELKSEELSNNNVGL